MFIRILYFISFFLSIGFSVAYAVIYPTAPNPGGTEVTGGYFNTYFTNMFTDCYA